MPTITWQVGEGSIRYRETQSPARRPELSLLSGRDPRRWSPCHRRRRRGRSVSRPLPS